MKRLDLTLASRHPYYSRTQIKKRIEEGFVLVDGKSRKASYRLRGGEEIRLLPRGPKIPEAGPEPIPLEILHEDDRIVVVNKPAGMVVHPAPGNPTGTLLNALLHHCPGKAVRLAHRLDKGTSGVLLIAKDEGTQANLAAQFKRRKVEKVYHALAFGRFSLAEGTIARAIGRDAVHRRKFSSRSRRLRESVTHYRVVKQFPGLALLEIRPETGRTHQIRVHLSEEHHPIVGDTVYGARSFLSSIKEEALKTLLEAFGRPALHASRLKILDPATGSPMTFEAPLPEDMKGLLQGLEGV